MTTLSNQIEMAESLLGTDYIGPFESILIATAARQYHRHGNDETVLTDVQRETVEMIYTRCFVG